MMKQLETIKKVSACTLGALLAVVFAPGAIAHADPTDQDFNNFLQSHGASLGAPAFNVKAAQTMCHDLDSGYNQRDEVAQLTGSHRLDWGKAQTFVAAATANYCPQHHPDSKPSSK
jgi:Protein of unknown function (DUF732)